MNAYILNLIYLLMIKSLENLVIAASTVREEGEKEEGDTFHKLFIWNSSNPSNPRIINVPYINSCTDGFEDLKIHNDKLIVSNSQRLMEYDLKDLDKPFREIKNGGSSNLLYIINDKIVNIFNDVIQIRNFGNLDEIENPILLRKYVGENGRFGSVKFQENDPNSQDFAYSLFSLFLEGKEYLVINKTFPYILDVNNYILKKARVNDSTFVRGCWTEEVFAHGIDFQSAEINDSVNVYSLNDLYEKKDSSSINCAGFKTIRVHTLEAENGQLVFSEKKPLSLEKNISSIMLDADNNLKILAFENEHLEIITYDILRNTILDSKKIKISPSHIISKIDWGRFSEPSISFQITPYLLKLGNDIKIVSNNIEDCSGDSYDIYINSVSGAHREIVISGTSELARIPEETSSRQKYCEISLQV